MPINLKGAKRAHRYNLVVTSDYTSLAKPILCVQLPIYYALQIGFDSERNRKLVRNLDLLMKLLKRSSDRYTVFLQKRPYKILIPSDRHLPKSHYKQKQYHGTLKQKIKSPLGHNNNGSKRYQYLSVIFEKKP